MNCFSCFGSKKSRKSHSRKDCGPSTAGKNETKKQKPGEDNKKGNAMNQADNENIAAQTFTFRELATATKNFRQECLLGEGGFGRVFKGTLASTGQVVAVKQLDRNGMHGNKEFLVEVLMLSLLHHPNLVNLVGYCADGDQRLLVYEFMSGGSLEDHILDIEKEQKALDWQTRMKIAFGAAKGLEYLHDKANPPVIYRDLKPSNILLDEDLTPKLSDFGLAKLSNSGDSMHISSRVMGTYGYCAPEYARGGQLTLKSDVYSFGVVFLELITGRRALDTTRPMEEQNLVAWAQPLFRDPKRFPDMADPLLNKKFPEKDLNQAVAIAAMCLQEEPAARPLMSDVVTALSFLSLNKAEFVASPLPPSSPAEEELVINHAQETNNEDNSDKEARACDSHQNQNKHKEDNAYHPNESASSSYKSSRIMHDAGDSSSGDSSSGSPHQEALLRRNSSKKSSRKSSMNLPRDKSMSHRSSMNSQRDKSMSHKSSMNSQRDKSMSRKSSVNSQIDNKSMSRRSSMASRNDTEYLSYKSISRNGSSSFENNSMKGSNDGSSHFDQNDD